MAQSISPEQVVNFLKFSANATKALIEDVWRDPQAKEFVLNVGKAIVAKKLIEKQQQSESTVQISSSDLKTSPELSSPIISTSREEELTINDHTYSGTQLRRILSRMLVAVILASGLTVVFKNREQIKAKVKQVVNAMDFDSVLEVLKHIIQILIDGLKTIKSKSATMFKSLLKKTKVTN